MIKYIPKYTMYFTLIIICFISLFAIKTKRDTEITTQVVFAENINLKKSVNIETLELINNATYEITDFDICSSSNKKTYMNYKLITSKNSAQYKFIHNYMNVDETTGLLRYVDDEEFIGVALGSYFGPIGSMYEFTLSSGAVMKVVKVEAKSDNHTINGCYQTNDKSVIEFVMDTNKALNYYSSVNGNFNNVPEFNGNIVSIRKYEKR